MAGKISDLTALTDPTTVLSTDLVEVVAGGTNKKVALDILLSALLRVAAAGSPLTYSGGTVVISGPFGLAGDNLFNLNSLGLNQVSGAHNTFASSATQYYTGIDTGYKRLAAGVVGATDGSSGGGFFQSTAGRKRTTVQVDATTATLANLTALAVTVAAGRTYKFTASLPVTADVVGGYKVAIAGTCTATTISYDVIAEANGIAPGLSRQSALGGAASGSLGTTVRIWIEGLITVNAGGTLVPQFAQSGANGTSSVLVGADFAVDDVP